MKFTNRLLVAACASSSGAVAVTAGTSDVQPRYRISPIDGSKIGLPTKQQLDFQDREIGVLIHFNIATYLDIDGCNNVPELVPKRGLFDPKLIDTDQWMESAALIGAKYATLVAKHNCGFTLWPSATHFPTRDGTTAVYNYTVLQSPAHGKDIVQSFSDSATKFQMGHGFYYSSVVNNFLNVQSSKVRDGPLSEGQVGITTETYDKVVYDQLTELWSNYGNLTEIWFDGGYSGSQKEQIQSLLQAHQPQAVIFNGCQEDGVCVSENSIRWVGTETGKAPKENWSTGLKGDGGDPSSPYFNPTECDTTLQMEDRWFFGVNQPLRSLEELVEVYHKSVGRNCLLEMDLSPDRRGLIPDNHIARYKELGDFIQTCYAKPVTSCRKKADKTGGYSLKFPKPTEIDRIVLMENQTDGQVIRSYQVWGKIAPKGSDTSTILAAKKTNWTLLSNGESVGHKRIDIFDKAVTVMEVKVNSTFVDMPKWRSVSVHSCQRDF